jgi:hypothetical protein
MDVLLYLRQARYVTPRHVSCGRFSSRAVLILSECTLADNDQRVSR